MEYRVNCSGASNAFMAVEPHPTSREYKRTQPASMMTRTRTMALPRDPDFLRQDHFRVRRQDERGGRFGVEREPFVAGQILIVGAEKAAGRMDHERRFLPLDDAEKVVRFDA